MPNTAFLLCAQFISIYTLNDLIVVECNDATLTIDPKVRSTIPHRLALATVTIDGQTQYSVKDNKVIIPAGATIVDLFFSTFNHVNASNVQFEYRIDGGTWQMLDPGTNRISFINLPKGKYELEVRATDDDGFRNDDSIIVYLDRQPAWWETWWAYLIYGLLTVTIIVSADRLWQRYKATKRKVAELQARLDEYLRRNDAQIDKVAEVVTDNSADREFLERAISFVEANMSNSDLDIDSFCSEMGLSRSSFYRKFADITGQKPAEFVRSIRLKRAAELIKSGGLSMSEVAYKCGFSSPSYFNRRFKEMFGVPPGEYNC